MAKPPLPRDVRRAIELMNADPARRHTIQVLARSCCVAPRTLQRHFRQFVGRSPVEVLRDLRLDLVRRELLRGACGQITELAIRYGFNHLGRFAGWYQDRYGETPSATARREQRGPPPSRAPAWTLSLAIDRPVIAVLPFEVTGLAAHHAAGLAEALGAALVRLHRVTVGSRRDARYHVHGSVRTDESGQLRITVTLLDAVSTRCLWADTWSGERDDAFAFQERVAHRITAKLHTALRDAEIERAWHREPEELTAWELTMRSLSRAVIVEPGAQTEALELAERAMELAPHDPLPVALAAWCHGNRAGHNFSPRPAEERQAAKALARCAAQLRARDPTAEALLASAYTLAHDLDLAALHVERALDLDGGCPWAWQRGGWIKVYSGQPAEAVEHFQIARALDPLDPLGFLNTIGLAAANFEAARYREAAHWFKRGIAESPGALWANRFLAPSYALSGRKDEARASLGELTGVYPDWTIARVRTALPHTASFVDRASTGLESVGMRL